MVELSIALGLEVYLLYLSRPKAGRAEFKAPGPSKRWLLRHVSIVLRIRSSGECPASSFESTTVRSLSVDPGQVVGFGLQFNAIAGPDVTVRCINDPIHIS